MQKNTFDVVPHLLYDYYQRAERLLLFVMQYDFQNIFKMYNEWADE